MDFNVKDGSTYLDGVPVKISSSFIPPRPIPLPFAFDDDPSYAVLEEEYDFTLEKSVIEHHSKRLLQLAEEKSKPPTQSETFETNNGNSSNESLNDKEPSSAQDVLSWQADSILQPKFQQSQDKELSEATSHNNVMKINLSEFENDTSSPFDYMELQTINDLEELSSVFQGIHNSSQQELSSAKNDASEVTGNVTKSKSFPFPLSSSDRECTATDRDHGHGSLPTSSYEIPHATTSTLKQMEDYPSHSYLKLFQVPYISSNTGARAKPATIPNAPSYMRGCKSYSDISSLGKTEKVSCGKERSLTPPTISYSTDTEELPCNEVVASNGVCDGDNGLPDPYDELENSAKDFVDSIAEMGFSRPQVARTVKHLGTDEKKVVEHLCQIQALEESGYEGLEAEAALHLHDYNTDEAKMFLDLLSQFQDLGFDKKKVKKALVQNKNDWNKTIDALLL